MTHQERLSQIIEQEEEKEIIPFLTSLTSKERKTVTPFLKRKIGFKEMAR